MSNITALESFKLIISNNNNPDFIIIDIRTQDEYDAYHIENSIIIDFYKDIFAEELNKLDKNKTYLIYCRTGRRTGTDENNALDLMKSLGFNNVYNMLGGIHAFVKIPETDSIIN